MELNMTESISQLEMQIEALRNKIALKKEEQREEALLKVTEILREYGLKLEDIMTVKDTKKQKVETKYRFESNAWSGRGRTPKWVMEICEQQNISLEDFKNDSRFKV